MTLSPTYCSECGSQNIPGAKFCATCGHTMLLLDTSEPSSIVNPTATGLLPQDSLLNKRYSIRKLVGSGGMGAVYKAEDKQFGNRLVAIKEMRQSNLNPQELEIATGQFKVEANMLAHLKHRSLPVIYEYFQENNRWYLVMEFIDGETLDERMRRTPGKKLPPLEVLDNGIQLSKVLDYLHKRQPPVVFRDLKPSNVMLTHEGHLYLIDFGIARIFKPGQAKDTKAYGSIGYSAPEQFDREQTTAQADIYSLGITLHEMLSGSVPSLTPFSMPRLNFPGQPALERLAALIARMIELDKEKRPASAAEVRQELESIRDALRQATFIPSIAQLAAPSTQYTPQPAQQPGSGHLAPTQYVAPPMAGTVAFTESAQQPVVAAQLRQPAARRNVLTIGSSQIFATVVGIIIYAVVTFILGKVFVDAQATGGNFLFSAISPGEGFHSYTVVWGDFVLGIFFFIPCFFGAKYGPLAGLAVALIGTLLGDVTSQFLPAWYWFAGLAVLGCISGLAYIRTRGIYNTVGNIILAIALSIVGIVIWAIIRLSGDFTIETQSFGIPFSNVLTLALVQLVSLIPLLLLLIAFNAFTKARAR